MANTSHDENIEFEDEVRRIARELWPIAEYGGARIIDGLERDGVFETEECIHLVEATVSRTKAKAEKDCKKLKELAALKQRAYPSKAVRCWFVTREEPTADQKEVSLRTGNQVIAVSFSQFQSKLVNAKQYLELRQNHPFGSVRDPISGSVSTEIEYIPLDIVESGGKKLWTTVQIAKGLARGESFVMLGDYGAGKSMTLREIHQYLRRLYFKNDTPKFPVYINLREHFGQTSTSEVLERHARSLGFPNPSHIVRAWRAGYVILLLDGFDELTTTGIQGVWKTLRQSRFRAVEAIRHFVRDTPITASIVITGREHFFDSAPERRLAMGLDKRFTELRLNEFTDEQITRYLVRSGLQGKVPIWMPSRPLLVGYLAASGILQDIVSLNSDGGLNESSADPAKGWNFLLDRICSRESEIEPGIDGPTVRRILERLSTYARNSSTGLGPLSTEQILEAFVQICGHQPDEKGFLLLQRLPGLGIDKVDEGTRLFLDSDFADACRAGDVWEFISAPFDTSTDVFSSCETPLGHVGLDICILKSADARLTAGMMNAVIGKINEGATSAVLLFDVVRVARQLGHGITRNIFIQDILIPFFDLDQSCGDMSRVTFADCYFTHISIDSGICEADMPSFYSCFIGELEGRSSRGDIPAKMFDANCTIDRFSEATESVDAIGDMELPRGTIVLLTVLRKIYMQRGSGRKENALHRGLDHQSRRLVPGILSLLEAEGLVIPYRRSGLDMVIWMPNRSMSGRVQSIVSSPRNCNDQVIEEAASISER